MSAYLTVVFSNKMKGLLIVLSVRLSVFVLTSSDSESAPMRILEYVVHDNAAHSHAKQTDYIFI